MIFKKGTVFNELFYKIAVVKKVSTSEMLENIGKMHFLKYFKWVSVNVC